MEASISGTLIPQWCGLISKFSGILLANSFIFIDIPKDTLLTAGLNIFRCVFSCHTAGIDREAHR
jgi:hypothetical protein